MRQRIVFWPTRVCGAAVAPEDVRRPVAKVTGYRIPSTNHIPPLSRPAMGCLQVADRSLVGGRG